MEASTACSVPRRVHALAFSLARAESFEVPARPSLSGFITPGQTQPFGRSNRGFLPEAESNRSRYSTLKLTDPMDAPASLWTSTSQEPLAPIVRRLIVDQRAEPTGSVAVQTSLPSSFHTCLMLP